MRPRSFARRLTGLLVAWCAAVGMLVAQGGDQALRSKAAQLFAQGNFAEALPLYSQLVSLSPADRDLNFRLGACIVESGEDKDKAVGFLKYAVEDPSTTPLAWYYLGRAQHLTYRFRDALASYQHFRGTGDKKLLGSHPVDALEKQCRNGQNLLANLKEVTVRNKVAVGARDFFRFYDLSDVGGRIVVTPDELRTSLDKKNGYTSLIHLPDKGGPIYFSSFGKDGRTGRDIYRTELLPDGRFAEPVRLAGYINTDQDEDYPFMAADGRTFYFCSKGHSSMGGFDVFRSTYDRNNDVFGAPQNMDFAVNTPDDDIFYLVDPEGKEACFASARASAQGQIHVYRVSTRQQPVTITILKGTYASELDKQDRDARIVVEDATTHERVAEVRTDINGTYILNLPRNGRYKFMVEAGPTKRTHVGMVDVPKSDGPRAYRQELTLVMHAGQEKLMIRNYFDDPLPDDLIALSLDEIRKRAQLNVSTHEPAAVAAQPAAATPFDDLLRQAGLPADVDRSNVVQLAEADAREATQRREELKVERDAALGVAVAFTNEADRAAKEARELVTQADQARGETERNALMTEAAGKRAWARQAALQARAARQAAEEVERADQELTRRAAASTQLATQLRSAMDRGDAEATAAQLQALKTRLDEKNRPGGEATPQIKAREEASARRVEADRAMRTAQTSREELDVVERRVLRLERERAETKSKSRQGEIDRELTTLRPQMEALRSETTKAFTKARQAERTASTAEAEQALLQHLAEPSASPTGTELNAQQVAELGRKIDVLDDDIAALPIDERYGGDFAEEDRVMRMQGFVWEMPAFQANMRQRPLTAPAHDLAANASGGAPQSTRAMEAGAAGSDGTGQGQPGTQAADTQGRPATLAAGAEQQQGREDLALAPGAHNARPPEEAGAGGTSPRTEQAAAPSGQPEGQAPVAPVGGSDGVRPSDGGGTRGLSPGTGPVVAAGAVVAGQQRTSTNEQQGSTAQQAAPTGRTDGDKPGADQVALTAPQSAAGRDSANDLATAGGGVARPEEEQDGGVVAEAAGDRRFVLENERMELTQLRANARTKRERDELDQRIAALDSELLALSRAAVAPPTEQEVVELTAQPVTGVARAFAPATSDDALNDILLPGYARDRARLAQVQDLDERAASLNGLELMMVDSIQAETMRQLMVLERDPAQAENVLPRVDRLRRMKLAHQDLAAQAAAQADRTGAASDLATIPADATPRSMEAGRYVRMETAPDHVYESQVVHRTPSAREAELYNNLDRAQMEKLSARIDTMEARLQEMPPGKERDKLRKRTDKYIDDRLILRTELGQRMEFSTREEYLHAADSLKRVRRDLMARGVRGDEALATMAQNLETEARTYMDQARTIRRQADRSEDIIQRDDLFRQAYAMELQALGGMDKAITISNFMLTPEFQPGMAPSYEAIEVAMFGRMPDAQGGALADGSLDRPTPVAPERDAATGNEQRSSGVGESPAEATAPLIAGTPQAEVRTERSASASPTAAPAAVTLSAILLQRAMAAEQRAADLEVLSLDAADRATESSEAAAKARRADREALQYVAMRSQRSSDSLHREAERMRDSAAWYLASSRMTAERERLEDFLKQYYYLNADEEMLVLDEPDYSRYFGARSRALEQLDQAAEADLQAQASRDLARDLVRQAQDVLTGDGRSAPTEGQRIKAAELNDRAVMLNARADSLRADAARKRGAADLSSSQAATMLQGLSPERSTAIMALEQRTRRVDPLLSQALAGATPVPPPAEVRPEPARVERPEPTAAATPPAAVRPTAIPADAWYLNVPERLEEDLFVLKPATEKRMAAIPMDVARPKGVVYAVQIGAFRKPIPMETFSDLEPVMGEQVGADLVRYTAGMFHEMSTAVNARDKVRQRGYRDAFVVVYVDGQRVSFAEAERRLAAEGRAQPAPTVAARPSERPATEVAVATPVPAQRPESRPVATAPVMIQSPASATVPGAANAAPDATDEQVLNRYPASAKEIVTSFTPEPTAADYYNVPGVAPAKQVEVIRGLFFTVQVGVYSKPVALDKLFGVTPLNSERTETGKIRYTTGIYRDMDPVRVRREQAVGQGVTDAFITAYLNGKRIPLRDARALLARHGVEILVDPALVTP
ncbi:MAG: PD40 domain-containing protein [Flavobacteriales bacterium]|nr:PD40 domain-containing protein [Flavobacteriales bacterium]